MSPKITKAKARKLIFMAKRGPKAWVVLHWDPGVSAWRESERLSYFAAQSRVTRWRAELLQGN